MENTLVQKNTRSVDFTFKIIIQLCKSYIITTFTDLLANTYLKYSLISYYVLYLLSSSTQNYDLAC